MALDTEQATRLLTLLAAGNRVAGEELFALLHTELRAIAEQCMRRQSAGHTLQPTALVHEAWMRLVSGGERAAFANRSHFVRTAARAMRQVLVDHARRRRAEKRGSRVERVPLDLVLDHFATERIDVVALSDALEELARRDPDLARIVELRFFAGLPVEEVADTLQISERSVARGWQVARLWLQDALAEN